MSWPAKHPGPWRCEFDEIWPAVTDQPILDANGEPVVVTDSGCYPPDPETARAIVDAMNCQATLFASRDRMRDLVRRLADFIGKSEIDWLDPVPAQLLLREAREALIEDVNVMIGEVRT